jgi:hypothetical protein
MERFYHLKIWRIIFSVFLIYSVCVQAVGAFGVPMQWNSYYSIDLCPEYLWKWKNGQIASSIFGVQTNESFPKIWNRGECISRTGIIKYDDQRIDTIYANSRMHEQDFLVIGCFSALETGFYRLNLRAKIRQQGKTRPLTVELFSYNQMQLVVDSSLSGSNEKNAPWKEYSFDFSLTKEDKIEFRLFFEGEGEVWVDSILLDRLNFDEFKGIKSNENGLK